MSHMTPHIFPSLSFVYFCFITYCHVCQSLSNSPATPPQKTNFLYIMYDDLRPELSIYGNPHMITPNFERLAKRSVTFDYAFCQV